MKVAVVGVGNCFSALWQGIEKGEVQSLIKEKIGKYKISDLRFVAGFDVSERKINRPLHEAIYEAPNRVDWVRIEKSEGWCYPAPVLDGVGKWVEKDFAPHNIKKDLETWKRECLEALKESGAEVIISYLPVGSERAALFWADVAVSAGLGYVNAMPTFIVSHPQWDKKFRERGIAAVGDDMKGQLGATVLHRWLVRLLKMRKLKVEETFQINVGGNSDFKNMLERERLKSKKISKTEAVRSVVPYLEDENIHVGPSDFVPFLKNTKLCYIYLKAHQWGGCGMEIECKLKVNDKANAAPIAADALRIAKACMDNGIYGALKSPSAYLMKHPPVQMEEERALEETLGLVKALE